MSAQGLLQLMRDDLKRQFKRNETEWKYQRETLKDILLDGIKIQLKEEDTLSVDEISQNIVYYICGYMCKQISKNKCTSCISTISCGFENLPENFNAAQLTAHKSKGWLKFVSTEMFHLISKVEFMFCDFCETGDVWKDGAFADLLYTICVDTLPKIGCSDHYLEFKSNIIYDYLICRFKCLAKEKRIELCEAKRTRTHKNRKFSKLI